MTLFIFQERSKILWENLLETTNKANENNLSFQYLKIQYSLVLNTTIQYKIRRVLRN